MLREHKLGEVPMRFLGFARTRLIELYQFCQENRLHSMVKWFALPNDFKLMVRVFGDDGWIRVSGGACPPLLSGLIEAVVHPIEAPDALVLAGEEQVFRRFYEKGSAAWKNTPALTRSGPQSITKRPGMYSGEMRSVVQDHLGRNFEFEYSPSFSVTHGIYTAGNGSKWIIEISASGVFAWPLQTCTLSQSEKLTGLDYIPLPTQRPEDPNQIAPASELEDAYAESPWYSEQGWAFSANGSKAANVTIAFGVPPNTLHIHSRMWEITITENNNQPTGATMVEVKSGYIWSTRVGSQGWLKVPDYSISHLPITSAIDLNYGLLSGPAADGAPVYCWYEGETRKECLWHRDETVTSDPETPAPVVAGEPWQGIIGVFRISGTATLIKNCFSSPVLPVQTNNNLTGREVNRFVTHTAENSTGWPGFFPYVLGHSVVIYQDDRQGMNRTVNSTDILVCNINDRESVTHIRSVNSSATIAIYDRLSIEAHNGFYVPGTTLGPGFCLSGNCDSPPSGYGAWSKDNGESSSFAIGGLTTSPITNRQIVSSPPGWCPAPGCPEIGWFINTNDLPHFFPAIFTRTNEVEVSTSFSGGAWVQGSERSIDLSATDFVAWEDHNSPQVIMAVSDMTRNISPIYSKTPYPDTSPLGDTLNGGGSYPASELTSALVSWIGNP